MTAPRTEAGKRIPHSPWCSTRTEPGQGPCGCIVSIVAAIDRAGAR